MRTKSTVITGEGMDSFGVLETGIAQDPADWATAHRMLDEDHLLRAGREADDRLCQFILKDSQPVALLERCASPWHLRDRDEQIVWDTVTREAGHCRFDTRTVAITAISPETAGLPFARNARLAIVPSSEDEPPSG